MTSTSAASQRPTFPVLVEAYFCDYLQNQRNVSPQTIASYRDTFRLFLHFTAQRYRRLPTSLTLRDLDAPRVLAFLDHLEQTRHNGVRSRNLRLAAIRSFLRYAGLRDPAALAPIQRTLAIPLKRFDWGFRQHDAGQRLALGIDVREERHGILLSESLTA
jgi:site-specific recombinase XerC